MTKNENYRVLSLDGGGGKGVYTLGVLREIEQLSGKPLNQVFNLFYGTSTGSIIAAALATGASCDEIVQFYLKKLPAIMDHYTKNSRSEALCLALKEYFGEKTFSDVPVGLGIVGTNVDDRCAIIFKSLPELAHGTAATFKPGFGLTLAEAVEASCSATPFFNEKKLVLKNSSPVTVIDGGFVANNPALYALIDVRKALKIPDDRIRILSVGTGTYPEKYPMTAYLQGVWMIPTLKLISLQFTASANATQTVFSLLSRECKSVRVNGTFAEPELATSLFEHREHVLHKLLSKGRKSFSLQEDEIKDLLNDVVKTSASI